MRRISVSSAAILRGVNPFETRLRMRTWRGGSMPMMDMVSPGISPLFSRGGPSEEL